MNIFLVPDRQVQVSRMAHHIEKLSKYFKRMFVLVNRILIKLLKSLCPTLRLHIFKCHWEKKMLKSYIFSTLQLT
jgi:hypothetical protein